MLLPERLQVGAAGGFQGRFRAQLDKAVRMLRAIQGRRFHAGRHGPRVFALLRQFADAAGALAFHLGRGELRVLHHVGQHVERLREGGFQRRQLGERGIRTGARAQEGAELRHVVGDLRRAARTGPFLQQLRRKAG